MLLYVPCHVPCKNFPSSGDFSSIFFSDPATCLRYYKVLTGGYSQAGSDFSKEAGFAWWTGGDLVLRAKRVQANLVGIISVDLVPREVCRTQLLGVLSMGGIGSLGEITCLPPQYNLLRLLPPTHA